MVCTSRRRSCTLMRSCRVSSVSSSRTGTAAGINAGVDEVHGQAGNLHAVGQGVTHAVRTREGG